VEFARLGTSFVAAVQLQAVHHHRSHIWVHEQSHTTKGEKKRKEQNSKEKTTPFGINLMRSPVLSRAAQDYKRMLDLQ